MQFKIILDIFVRKEDIMKNSFKKLVSLFTSLCVMTAGTLSITANAVYNKTDITGFNIPANISNRFDPLPQDYYPIRSKDTSSSVYLKLTQATNGAFVQVWGLVDADWNNTCANVTLDAYYNNVNYVSTSIGTNYLHNNVYEYGYGLCGLKFQSAYYYVGSTITGEWAPDC